jgi:hypothetical protein
MMVLLVIDYKFMANETLTRFKKTSRRLKRIQKKLLLSSNPHTLKY